MKMSEEYDIRAAEGIPVEVKLPNTGGYFEAFIMDIFEDKALIYFPGSWMEETIIPFSQIRFPPDKDVMNVEVKENMEAEVFIQKQPGTYKGWFKCIIKALQSELCQFEYMGDHSVVDFVSKDMLRPVNDKPSLNWNMLYVHAVPIPEEIQEYAKTKEVHDALKLSIRGALIKYDPDNHKVNIISTNEADILCAKILEKAHVRSLTQKTRLLQKTDKLNRKIETAKSGGFIEEFTISDNLIGIAVGREKANLCAARNIEGISFIQFAKKSNKFIIYGETEKAVSEARELLEIRMEYYFIPQSELSQLVGKNSENMYTIIEATGLVEIFIPNSRDLPKYCIQKGFLPLAVVGTSRAIIKAKIFIDFQLNHIFAILSLRRKRLQIFEEIDNYLKNFSSISANSTSVNNSEDAKEKKPEAKTAAYHPQQNHGGNSKLKTGVEQQPTGYGIKPTAVNCSFNSTNDTPLPETTTEEEKTLCKLPEYSKIQENLALEKISHTSATEAIQIDKINKNKEINEMSVDFLKDVSNTRANTSEGVLSEVKEISNNSVDIEIQLSKNLSSVSDICIQKNFDQDQENIAKVTSTNQDAQTHQFSTFNEAQQITPTSEINSLTHKIIPDVKDMHLEKITPNRLRNVVHTTTYLKPYKIIQITLSEIPLLKPHLILNTEIVRYPARQYPETVFLESPDEPPPITHSFPMAGTPVYQNRNYSVTYGNYTMQSYSPDVIYPHQGYGVTSRIVQMQKLNFKMPISNLPSFASGYMQYSPFKMPITNLPGSNPPSFASGDMQITPINTPSSYRLSSTPHNLVVGNMQTAQAKAPIINSPSSNPQSLASSVKRITQTKTASTKITKKWNPPESHDSKIMKLVELLQRIGYDGPMLNEPSFKIAINIGLSSPDYNQLIIYLTEEIHKFKDIREHITPMSNPLNDCIFSVELGQFLREIDCPYSKLMASEVSTRLQTTSKRRMLIKFFAIEIICNRLLQNSAKLKELKNYMIQKNLDFNVSTMLEVLNIPLAPSEDTFKAIGRAFINCSDK